MVVLMLVSNTMVAGFIYHPGVGGASIALVSSVEAQSFWHMRLAHISFRAIKVHNKGLAIVKWFDSLP